MDKSTIFLIAIAITQMLIGLFAFAAKLIKDGNQPWYKRLTLAGHTVVNLSWFLAACTIIVIFAQIEENDKKEELNEIKILEHESKYIQALQNQSTNYTILQNKSKLEVTDALAKYGLEYDESKKEILKSVENQGNKNKIFSDLVLLLDGGIKLDTINDRTFNITFMIASLKGASKDVNISVYTILNREYIPELI